MPMPKEEFSRREQYYAAIAGRNGVKPAFPMSRTEEYLNAIDEYLDTKADLVNGKVPASQLPSYVDDVLEFPDKESFPTTGEAGKIYVALDTGKTYRWGGSTYVEISTGEFAVYKLDMSNSEQWDAQENKPTDAVIEEIATHNYNAIRVLAEDDGIEYVMWLTAGSGANIDEADTHLRNFYKFDEGDEDEGQPPYMEQYIFMVQPLEDSEDDELEYIFAVEEYPLGGGGSGGGVYFVDISNPVSGTRCTLDLEAITAAMDEGQEVLIKFPSYGSDPDAKFFTLASVGQKRYFQDVDEAVYTPTFTCQTIDHEFAMVFDEYDDGSFYYNIAEGGRHFTPTSIDMGNNEISFDVDDYTYMWNFQPEKMTVDISERGASQWMTFTKAYYSDIEPGFEELYYYATMPMVDPDTGDASLYTAVIRLHMNSGNVETDYHIIQNGGVTPL